MSTPPEPTRENAVGLLQRYRSLSALALLTVVLGSCGTPLRHSPTPNTLGTDSPSRNLDATVQRHLHVFVVVMENLSFSIAMQTASIRALALRYGYATNYYAIAHPSFPNYLALTSGSVESATTDCTNCVRDAPNTAESMSNAGLSWGAYL